MVKAPVDLDVTCVAYVTASVECTNIGDMRTCCRVFLRAIPELSSEQGQYVLNSPIYNVSRSFAEGVWSVGWNSHKMLIGLGR
jgi:hypothetical protein